MSSNPNLQTSGEPSTKTHGPDIPELTTQPRSQHDHLLGWKSPLPLAAPAENSGPPANGKPRIQTLTGSQKQWALGVAIASSSAASSPSWQGTCCCFSLAACMTASSILIAVALVAVLAIVIVVCHTSTPVLFMLYLEHVLRVLPVLLLLLLLPIHPTATL